MTLGFERVRCLHETGFISYWHRFLCVYHYVYLFIFIWGLGSNATVWPSDLALVHALVAAGANVNVPKPAPERLGNSEQANQLREILTPSKMLAFKKKIAMDRKAAIERFLDENPVKESERTIIQGQAMPTRLESDLEAVNAQIAKLAELEAALK